MVVLEQKDSRIDQCQLSGGIEVSLLDGGGVGGGRTQELQAVKVIS